MKEKAEQERIETEKVFIKQLQTLSSNLQTSSQSALRTAYNVGRYGTGDYERGGEIEPALQTFESGLRAAYRRVEQYFAERRQTVERKAKRKPRGMSR